MRSYLEAAQFVRNELNNKISHIDAALIQKGIRHVDRSCIDEMLSPVERYQREVTQYIELGSATEMPYLSQRRDITRNQKYGLALGITARVFDEEITKYSTTVHTLIETATTDSPFRIHSQTYYLIGQRMYVEDIGIEEIVRSNYTKRRKRRRKE